MNTVEALDFLRQHQPMPPDEKITQDQISTYDSVRLHFTMYREPEAIPLILGSFGEGSGFGVYQLMEDCLRHYNAEELSPHIAYALKSEARSVRFWNATIASAFPSPKLLDDLRELLSDRNSSLREAALTAIAAIGGAVSLETILRHQVVEKDPSVREVIAIIRDHREAAS